VQLPGGRYRGADPDGYMPKDQIVTYLEGYAASFVAPVREGVEVVALGVARGGGSVLRTSAGELHARFVVIGTGAYQRPHRPAGADSLPAGLAQLDVEDYHNPAALPPGRALVVGSGQSGVQIVEELHQADREVVLACGRAPWAPRRLGGRDIFWWIVETGFLDAPVTALPTPAARLDANILATGHQGGHDLHRRAVLRRCPLPAQAQVVAAARRGRGCGACRRRDRSPRQLSHPVPAMLVLQPIIRRQAAVSLTGAGVGGRDAIADEHLPRPPSGDPHQIALVITSATPGVREGMAEHVRGRSAMPACRARRSSRSETATPARGGGAAACTSPWPTARGTR
jgi:Pyridine nucleotide-disulphide oxidoreductase